MTGRPNINTEAVRQHAATVVRYSDERNIPVSELIRGTIPGLCDEVDALRQECRDRECTEQDVRARLVDAENTLARVVKVRDAWEQAALSPAAPAFVRLTLRDLRTALDGTS